MNISKFHYADVEYFRTYSVMCDILMHGDCLSRVHGKT